MRARPGMHPSLPAAGPRTYWRSLFNQKGELIPAHIELWAHATMYITIALLGAFELCGEGRRERPCCRAVC